MPQFPQLRIPQSLPRTLRHAQPCTSHRDSLGALPPPPRTPRTERVPPLCNTPCALPPSFTPPPPPRLRRIEQSTAVLRTHDAYSGDPEVDRDLWEVLDICDDDELEEIYNILHGASPLSPVIKSLVAVNEPPAVLHRGRQALMRLIEARFRFLAADSAATLRGRRPSYREALLAVRERLEVQCPCGLATQDLETEIFLHLLGRYGGGGEEGPGSKGVPADLLASASAAEGDGMAAPRRALWHEAFRGPGWMQAIERVAAPLKLGGAELIPALMKLCSAFTVTSMRGAALQGLGAQVLRQHIRYEAAVHIVCRGAGTLKARSTLHAAQTGLTAAAARYGAVQGALSTLGPVMWALFGAELALAAIGTDYGRVARAVFALAQVRLVRTHGFSSSQP